MRILFVLLGELGHVNPFMGICQRLSREGAEIAVHSGRDFTAQFARAGVKVERFGAFHTAAPASTALMAQRMRNPRWLEHWYRLALTTIPHLVESVADFATSFGPDVMCVDHSNLAGAIVARQQDVPWASISTNFTRLRPADWSCPFMDVGGRQTPAVLAPFGVSVDDVDGSPWYNTVFSTETFVPRSQTSTSNHHSHYVGPPRWDAPRGDEAVFPWERLDNRPLVYVSSGGGQSLGFDASTLLRIASTLGPTEAQIVMATHDLHDDEAFRAALPAHCISVRYAPQLEILDRAAVAVTHGGVNTFNECLDRGCPTLVLPLGKEQPLQAELARRSGVGLTLDPATFTTEQGREALLTLLADGSHRARAHAVRDSYRETDSTASIAAALGQLARGEKPARPT